MKDRVKVRSTKQKDSNDKNNTVVHVYIMGQRDDKCEFKVLARQVATPQSHLNPTPTPISGNDLSNPTIGSPHPNAIINKRLVDPFSYNRGAYEGPTAEQA